MIDLHRHYKNKCNVLKNKDLLGWLRIQTFKGYKPYVTLEDLQDIISVLTKFYEERYPNSEIQYDNFDKFDPYYLLSLENDFNYICAELSLEQQEFIEGYYSYKHFNEYQMFYGDHEALIPLITVELPSKIYKQHKPLVLQIRADNGLYSEIGAYPHFYNSSKFQTTTIDCFLEIIKKQKNYPYDISMLDKIVAEHNNNLILRKKILELTALNIMFSDNTNIEMGYERAKKFIYEFNQCIPNLNLDYSELNFIYEKSNNRNSQNKSVFVKKKYA